MCQTTHYRSRVCGHHWLQIRQPCFPGWGFNHCGRFGDGVAREPSPEVPCDTVCPACAAMPGGYAYDKNLVRMVVDIRDRWRWGRGPSRHDPGLECAVM